MSKIDQRKKRAEEIALRGKAAYGDKAAIVGRSGVKSNYYSTGILALDYALGTGGVPDNAFVEVFGPFSIGKTTIFGNSIISSVQKAGGITALIATEPHVDEDWMERHGVNLDYNVIFRPNSMEEAFLILKELVFNRDVDYIVYDSLAGGSSEKEQKGDKPQAYGNSALISWGLGNVLAACWKNRVGVMYINQIRDDTKATGPNAQYAVKSYGGHALEHYMRMRIQLKPGKNRFTARVESGGDGVIMVGRELVAKMIKNNASEGLGKTARFDYYHIETEDMPFGIDVAQDVINTGKLTGVITGTTWIKHPLFPNGKLNGKPALEKFLASHPEALVEIRKDIIGVMNERQEHAVPRPKLEAVE